MSAGPVISRLSTEQSRELSDQWRALRRAATGVAVLTSPALFVWLHKIQELSVGWSLVLTILSVAAFRGLLDLIFHRFIRWPSLFGIDNDRLREEDIVARRRASFRQAGDGLRGCRSGTSGSGSSSCCSCSSS